MLAFFVSGWQDSNLRPPRPKRGAITGLRYTPNNNAKVQQSFTSTRQMRRDWDSNPGYPFGVRLFSKQVLSATQASLLIMNFIKDGKSSNSLYISKYFIDIKIEKNITSFLVLALYGLFH
jgi:hypothetical protein